jgi:hypothetical protein
MANGTRQAAYVRCAFCGEALTCQHGNCTGCEWCKQCRGQAIEAGVEQDSTEEPSREADNEPQ